ncbi:MAG: hypothetical protein KBT18_02375 [Comamonas sp.]|nr:hypothetical protein [Candidatus Comamonas equi]
MATTASQPQPMRKLLLAVLLVVVAAVAVDTCQFAEQGEITALRTQAVDEDAGSVGAFCGFAPCGMPLECN